MKNISYEVNELETFNFIAGVASILSLIISICAFTKVYNIKKQINLNDNSTSKVKQHALVVGNKDTTVTQTGRES